MGVSISIPSSLTTMKLLLIGAALGLASALQTKLAPSIGISDDCEGCEVAPEDPYKCDRPTGCDSERCGHMAKKDCTGDNCIVDCSLPKGYYSDNDDCTAYCYCSGMIDEGTGLRVPSRWQKCPAGTYWDAGCGGWHKELANGMGFTGGCCNHPAAILDFVDCPGACERLSKYFCAKSNTCGWDNECNCCKEKGGDPKPEPRPDCVNVPIDVAFILDGSGSVGKGNFLASKAFLKLIVSRLGPDSRVATVQYSTNPALEFPFTSDYTSIYGVINAIPYQGKSTKTGVALKFTENNVIIDRRPNVETVVVILTDGVSYDDQANDVSIRGPEIQASHGGVTVVAVGVGKADEAQLKHIASSDDMVYMSKWKALSSVEFVNKLADQICVAKALAVEQVQLGKF